jgi:hypothetical protein
MIFSVACASAAWHSNSVVKNWPYILIILIVVFGVTYLAWTDRERLGLHMLGAGTAGHKASSENGSASSDSESSDNQSASTEKPSPAAPVNETKPAQVQWRLLTRPADGFRVELPAGPKVTEVPVYNETGGTENVKMLTSSPDGDTVYAVTWQDNPPIARVNNNVPNRTLDQARDGMLAHTQATLISESQITSGGFPGREILAHNSGGGVLNARLIYVQNSGRHDRLYTLMALFPATGARNEQDVNHFFNSFTMSGGPKG